MTIYTALLRGINVGGKNIIRMPELKTALEDIGFSHVQTYIQSGNVLFESEEEEALLRKRMEERIADVFRITLTVVMRTADEMAHIVRNCPFTEAELAEAAATCVGESLHVAMLPDVPTEAGIAKLAAADHSGDHYHIVGRDVYLLFQRSIRDSKLAQNLPKLGVQATVRNWNTMNKLVTLADAMKH